MFKILIVEDDTELCQLFSHVLEKNGYHTRMVSNGQEALDALAEEYVDLIISDIMMPVMDGYELVRSLRKKSVMTPVLMITARDAFDDMRLGFLSGTDDYMVKPFLPRELILRLYAILRRCYKTDDSLITLDECIIDIGKAEVNRKGTVFPLTAKEVGILTTLYKAGNRIVTIDSLCNSVWGDNRYGYENSLMAHIHRIREKIEENPSSPALLVTIKGLGYKLNV